MAARILVVRRAAGTDAATWSGDLAARLDAVDLGGWSVDLTEVDGGLRASRGMPPARRPYDGVVTTSESAGGDDPVPSWWSVCDDVADLAVALVVRTHHGWGPIDPGPGPAQWSLLRAAPGYDVASFRAHYRDHVGLAQEHMAAAARYVQHDVEAVHGRGMDDVLAVSEMRWETPDDVRDRYWTTPESQATFQAHEQWLDLPRAVSFFTTERVDGRG